MNFFKASVCCLFYTNALFAAQLVGSEITLCTNGYSPDNTTCVTYDSGDCDTGYYEIVTNATSFISPTNDRCTYASYKARTLPDTTITMAYHGTVLGDEINLCANGYSTNNTSCTTYSVGNCATDYYEIVTNATSFISPTNDRCTYASYKARTLPDTTITMEYHGTVLGDEINLCANGYSTNNTSCTTYDQGDCPNDYYDAKAGSTSFTAYNGSCASGYRLYNAQESCGYMPSESTCVSLCSDGLLTTNVGTCATLCDMGITTLRASNGAIVPLWTTQQTTPSINVADDNGTCYGNLTTESTNDAAIYVRYNDTTLHTTK